MKVRLLLALGISLTVAAGIGTVVVHRAHRAQAPAARNVGVASPSPASAQGAGAATKSVPASSQIGGGCAAVPHTCGFPDATDTGVPAGMALRSVPGQVSSGPGWHFNGKWVEVDGNGAVLSGLYIPYSLDVSASQVTIKDVRIVASGNGFGISLRNTHDVTVEDSDISSPYAGYGRLEYGIKDINNNSKDLTILRDNIWHTKTGVQLESGLIEGSYIHNPGYRPGDHTNGIASDGGIASPLTIRHNTILVASNQTDAIGLFEDFGIQADRYIEGNLLAGGGYIIYGGQNHGGPPSYNIVVTGNSFSRIFYAHGGYYGYVAYFNTRGRGNVWSGNSWSADIGPKTHNLTAGP